MENTEFRKKFDTLKEKIHRKRLMDTRVAATENFCQKACYSRCATICNRCCQLPSGHEGDCRFWRTLEGVS